ncbi:daunorubicin C-13 ketoreductase [Colletotrichum navitas]|uniref:Daunorubicin C-13 ketoreductase n=1 Tax=Colletotrichum navitas TaxID=681940 RepID=A0AAD8UZJ3_9PEZI|nr:daunorubicin C-13 ketoreductase [Colletotrichum navitas]KAK1569854.1 daunorubicin C-13 ketoreductase [Colletotrichum navitas]
MPNSWGQPLANMPPLQGKVAVVTGSNAGIGLSTVKFLALRGLPTKDKADATRARLTSEYPEIDQDQLRWLSLDLADLKTVDAAVTELKSKEKKVDILINNAGAVSSTTDTLGPGWEYHMTVNHIGHFVFTNGILPLLKEATRQKGADVRIITLSSSVNYTFLPSNYRFTFDSPSFLKSPLSYYPWQWRYILRHFLFVDMIRYAVSKVANILFAQELQRLMDEQGLPILSISVHPGGVASEGNKDIGNSLFSLVRSTFFLSTDQGAATSLFAATAREVRENPEKFKGKYLEPFGEVVTPNPVFEDMEQVRGMWDNTTTEVNKYLTEIGLAPLKKW